MFPHNISHFPQITAFTTSTIKVRLSCGIYCLESMVICCQKCCNSLFVLLVCELKIVLIQIMINDNSYVLLVLKTRANKEVLVCVGVCVLVTTVFQWIDDKVERDEETLRKKEEIENQEQKAEGIINDSGIKEKYITVNISGTQFHSKKDSKERKTVKKEDLKGKSKIWRGKNS